ncbi:MAG TPA: GTPase domain-containing protein [Trichormus sp. M33_DOE_039]|nr:GTPase domain-containing protein [Trichormus sp. M33_DOE_039]
MNLLPTTTPKTFSLLSIGQRGVGKTVFLAGSYTELHPDSNADNPQQLWFDCQDSEVQANLEKIKNHVARTGSYPPPTIKITNFNFSLQRQTKSGQETVCNFRWWDIPGELCNIHNPEFQEMILTSNGCCVFINAYALIHDPDYPKVIEDIYNQVAAIASVVYKYNIPYAFALILTKCDLLEINPATQLQIEENLKPLTIYLDTVKASHQIFYSAIPVVAVEGVSRLKAQGAANPLLWLLSQINHKDNGASLSNLASESAQSISNSETIPPKNRRSILVVYLVSVILLGAIASVFFAIHRLTSTPQPNPATEQSPNQTPENDVAK